MTADLKPGLPGGGMNEIDAMQAALAKTKALLGEGQVTAAVFEGAFREGWAAARKPGLPVAGYRPQSDAAIALVNEFKADEERLLRKLEAQKDATDRQRLSGANPAGTAEAMRWLAIARTHFQEGFMAFNRAVFKPARVKLPEDET